MGFSAFDEHFPLIHASPIQDSDGTDQQNLFSDQLVPCRLDHIWVWSDDTVDRSITLSYSLAGSSWQFGSFTIPAGAGTLGAGAFDLMLLINPPGVDGLLFRPGDHLVANMDVALTAGKTVQIVVVGGTF